jgi:hypothetical protein
MFKKFAVVMVAFAVAGCTGGTEQAPPAATQPAPQPAEPVAATPAAPASQAPVVTLVPNKAIAVLGEQEGKQPMPLVAGQSIAGSLAAPQQGQVVGFDIFIGNYRNTSDGTLEVKLCQAGVCQTGTGQLMPSRDNRYLTIPLASALMTAAGPMEYTVAKVGGAKRVAVWTSPAEPAELTAADGAKVARAPLIRLRYAKEG